MPTYRDAPFVASVCVQLLCRSPLPVCLVPGPLEFLMLNIALEKMWSYPRD